MPKYLGKQLMPHAFGNSLVSSMVLLNAGFGSNFKHDFLINGVDAEDDFVPASIFNV
jgi:hypothetical protein